jgi:arginyl-tRNA synthetase
MVNLPDGKNEEREGTVVDADELVDTLTSLARKEIEAKEREALVDDVDKTVKASPWEHLTTICCRLPPPRI